MTTTKDNLDLVKKINETRLKLWQTRLEIKAGKNKNLNAHRPLNKLLAQLLTKLHQSKVTGK